MEDEVGTKDTTEAGCYSVEDLWRIHQILSEATPLHHETEERFATRFFSLQFVVY
ncbi:MAG: hypothetical protein ACUVS3_00555 [Thermodesulfobacteriota bacterium]